VRAGTLAVALCDVARGAIADCEGGALAEAALAGRADEPFVCGAGKAVEAMALGAWRALAGRLRPGPLVGKDPGAAPSLSLPSPLAALHRPAGHPIPDARGARATDELVGFVAARAPGDRVILLLSGGASALLGGPVAPLSVEDLVGATRVLLASGLPIGAINVVRRHLGRALGGRLALATAASLEVLALSDVIGDDPATIGSGPAAPDPSTFADALAVARRVALPAEVVAYLERGARGDEPETPKPGDPRLARVTHRVLANPETLRSRAAEHARMRGFEPRVEPALVEGDVGGLAHRYAARLTTLAPGELLVAVGEPTVRLRGGGRGGRAQQLALEMALALAGTGGAFAALGSDGTDGPTDAAGAAVDGTTIDRARRAGHDPAAALAANDAYPLLRDAGALLVTGPTGTNLLDLHLLARE
jgi:glycerate-2-kinase